jgi:hypothetical protein
MSDWQGKIKHSEKTCTSAALSTTNPTWLNHGLNLGHHSEKLATNHLSYSMAISKYKSDLVGVQ